MQQLEHAHDTLAWGRQRVRKELVVFDEVPVVNLPFWELLTFGIHMERDFTQQLNGFLNDNVLATAKK